MARCKYLQRAILSSLCDFHDLHLKLVQLARGFVVEHR